MEEKTGKPYEPGRAYVTAYADFVSRFLAGGPDAGFYSSWSKNRGGRRDHGPWTYRLSDVVMFGHKYSADPGLRKRCLKAAADAFAFMTKRAARGRSIYSNGKETTMIIGGGHEYTYYRQKGRWPQ